MKRIPLVQGLWIGNAVALIIVIVALFIQLSPLIVPMKDRGELPPIRPQPLRMTAITNPAGLKNPFDAGAAHWKLTESRANSGGLHGILLLPGVSAAVTGSGIVYPGGQVSGGTLAQITRDGLIVRQENQTQEITLHAVSRPTLQTLNKAKPSVSKEKK